MTPKSYSGWQFLLYWAAVSILFPVLVLLSAWVVAKVGYGSRDAFVDFFGSGDLIPICALLLLGVWLDIWSNKDDKKHWLILVSEFCFMVFGIVSLVIYGFAKSYGISVTTSNTSADPVKLASEHDVLHLVGQMSWLFCAYAIIHAVLVKFALVYNAQIKEERREP